MSKITVEVSEGRTTYLPGNEITGQVLLFLDSETSVEKLEVTFTGKIATWLLKNTSNLVGLELFSQRETHNHIASAEGEHVYDFAFRVPPSTLPASTKTAFGQIYYSICATLSTPAIKLSNTLEITIPSSLDHTLDIYNQIVSLSTPRNTYIPGLAFAKISIPRAAYPCESICPLLLEIENTSNLKLSILQICIKQSVGYKVFGDNRRPRTELVYIYPFLENLDSKATDISRLIKIGIPNQPIMSPDVSSSILSVSHFIQIKIRQDSIFMPIIKLKIPIVIAGFPFMLFDADLRRSIDTLPIYHRT